MDRHVRQPPLANRYAPTAAVALLALCPNIVLTTAVPLLQQTLTGALSTSLLAVQTGEGLSNAGYAFGAVLAAFLVLRFKQRVLFLVTESVFVVGSLLAATAPSASAYVIGRTLQGATTGLMLIIALPPLVTQFGVRPLPRTAALVNVGLFGAVTAGPLIGGAAALSPSGWRLLFALVAVAGGLGVGLAALTLPQRPPFDPEAPADPSAFGLAAVATVLPFLGVSRLTSLPVTSPLVWAPMAVGVGALLALIVRQYRRSDALMPVRALSTSLPVIGTTVAMIAGAATVTLLELVVTSLLEVQHEQPLAGGALFAPMIGGLVVAAVVFAALFRSRWLAGMVFGGLIAVGGAGLLLLDPADHLRVGIGTALLGLGAGLTVSPGLFLAAFGVDSNKIGRAFALVELLRSEAAYLVGPVLLYVSEQQAALGSGLRFANWITLAVVAGGIAAMILLYVAGGVRPQTPELQRWLDGEGLALHSPPTAVAARERVESMATTD